MRPRPSFAAAFVSGWVALGPAGCQPGSAEDEASSESSTAELDSGSSAESSSSSETGADMLPPAPSLVSPEDGVTDVPIETELCWQLVEDPEGEPLRYRVYVDETQLSEGVLDEGEEGYAGPCVGPLLFAHERSYTWKVEAFEQDDPTRSSEPSETWTFTTIGDGLSERVFEDRFDEPGGWEISGDASSGAWVWGSPELSEDAGGLSQPEGCAGGEGCFFTGHNPGGIADQEDVSGTTVLLSPPFNLDGAAAVTVRVERFFYKSELLAGPSLTVELLVPDQNAPESYVTVELELLDAATADAPANGWTPREYLACELPDPAPASGSRLRITASDPGAGILEAAIDSVSVHAHDDVSLCEPPGEGGFCDPAAGPLPCPDPLLCCSQGVQNVGVYRCEAPVAGLDFDSPPASPDEPGNGALGCDAPDLIVDPQVFDPLFTDIFVDDATCELLEGCVGATGWRSLMLFTAAIPNIGSADLALGVPANLPELFHYSECHSHYHFDEFARYELLDGEQVVATGHKQAFCLLDTISWAWPLELSTFDCANQGISRGFTDFYESGLPCQWVDVTGVPPGEYTLRIALNQARPGHALPELNERDYQNNVIELPVTLP